MVNVTIAFVCVINGNLKNSDTIKYDLRMTVRRLTRVFHTRGNIDLLQKERAQKER